MTKEKFKSVRESFGMSQWQWAKILGYISEDKMNLGKQVSDMERGSKAIPRTIARLVETFDYFGNIPKQFLEKKEGE